MKNETYEGWIKKDIPIGKVIQWGNYGMYMNAYVKRKQPKITPENWRKIKVVVREIE